MLLRGFQDLSSLTGAESSYTRLVVPVIKAWLEIVSVVSSLPSGSLDRLTAG